MLVLAFDLMMMQARTGFERRRSDAQLAYILICHCVVIVLAMAARRCQHPQHTSYPMARV